jgi:hypothetical protein
MVLRPLRGMIVRPLHGTGLALFRNDGMIVNHGYSDGMTTGLRSKI